MANSADSDYIALASTLAFLVYRDIGYFENLANNMNVCDTQKVVVINIICLQLVVIGRYFHGCANTINCIS